MKAPRGHALLDVREEGHVPFVRPIGLGEREPALILRLARRVARVSVGPSGYTFALPGGALEIPPGAYPTPASMSATLVADVSVMPGDILFRMPGDRAARVLSVVEVDTSVQPAVGVTLRLPIPAGVDPAKLALYTLDEATGTWKEPVRPISVAGGVAAYTVTHFSERAQVVEGDDAVAIVRGCTAGSDIGGTPCQTGARIAAGEAVRTNGQVVELQMRNGTQATLGGKDVDHVVRDDDPVGEVTISPTCTSPTCTMSVRGSAPQASAPTPSGRMKMTVRTPPRPVVLGVRGTVFTWTSEACPGSAPSSTRASGDLAVSAGTVELQSGGAARAVDSGQSLRVCLGCATPSEAACCYDFASRACTSFGCSVHADTWVCADHERYVCTAGGLCDEPPANVSRVPPVRCSGGSDCPPTTPLCLRSASSLPDQGTCMPKDPIPSSAGTRSRSRPIHSFGMAVRAETRAAAAVVTGAAGAAAAAETRAAVVAGTESREVSALRARRRGRMGARRRRRSPSRRP